MLRKQLGSPLAPGQELRLRYLAGGGLAALGLLLMLAAFHPNTSDLVMQWVPAKVLSKCSFAACRSKGASPVTGEAEVEPWGVSDAESWSERPQPNASNASNSGSSKASDQAAQTATAGAQHPSQPDSVGKGSEAKCPTDEVKCPDCGEELRVMSQLLPGVGILAAAGLIAAPSEASLLRRLYARELAFPEDRLRRAVSNGGDPERLQRVLRRLIRGQPIHVATVGGSVTAGVGAESPNLSYRERLFEWIRDTFPHENHTFANGALAAAPSTYIHQCINDFVPANTDLVVVEFTMNDSQRQCGVDSDGRRGFEILLRKLLAYKRAPALIVLHWWSPRTKHFWQSAEDELEVFNKYYGLPSLSWRDAAHDLLARNATGFSFDDVYFDRGHPNGYNGHRYLAEMLIGFIRNEAALMLLSGTAGTTPKTVAQLRPVPEPMIEGNYEGNSYCMRGNAFRQAISEHQGWEWQDEGKNGRHKWGFVSWEPGARLVIKVNSKTYRGTSKVLVGVGILTSYERMGTALLVCESGCECEPRLLDGHTEEKSSQTEWVYHSVGQHEECVMSVTNSNATSDAKREHKFKVTSFLVTNTHENSISWFNRIDELAEKAAATERYLVGHRERLELKKEAARRAENITGISIAENSTATNSMKNRSADQSGEGDSSGKFTGGESVANGVSSSSTATRRRLTRAFLDSVADRPDDKI